MRFGSQIGPNLGFDENDSRRTNDGKRASHDWPKIQGRVHDLNPRQSVFVCQRKSGCGRRGQYAMHVRFERSQLLDQFESNHDFANADRVQPCRSFLATARQSRAQVAVVYSEALAEFFAVTAAANHFQQIAGQEEQKPDRPKQIVNEANH
jgi:hypothetical protein